MTRLAPARPSTPVRMIFPEGKTTRVAFAVRVMSDFNVRPIVDLGDPERFVEACAGLRGLPSGAARRLLQRPICLAAMMLRAGEADTILVGAESTTSEVIPALRMFIGGGPFLSSYFVIEAPAWPHGPLVMADCAVNPNPSARELAEIAFGAATAARRLLGIEPRVAMLSFSTHGSAVHPDAEKVGLATMLLRERAPELIVDGEVQADAALDAHTAARKGGKGLANVLVFPDLDAGNIGYKLVKVLGGAWAYGVFLQGLSHPAAKVSRGASVDEMVMTARLLALSCVSSDPPPAR